MKPLQDRDQWRLEQLQVCMYCGGNDSFLPLQVHEIERRSHTPKRWDNRANYLLLCGPCHSGPFATMPHAQQLAVKLIRDPENYNLDAWLRLRDPELRAPNRVTQNEVDNFVILFGEKVCDLSR
jgi:5-methylcytosine-specific restriction endonuclease McrA